MILCIKTEQYKYKCCTVQSVHSFSLRMCQKWLTAKRFLAHYEADTVHFMSPAQRHVCVRYWAGVGKLTTIPITDTVAGFTGGVKGREEREAEEGKWG